MSLQPFTPVDPDKEVGDPNPPGDMNNTSNELAALGGGYNVLNAAFSGGADPTDTNACDSALAAAVTALPASGGALLFPPGTYKITSGLTVPTYGVYLVAIIPGTVTFDYHGSGDCVRMYNPTYPSPANFTGISGWGGGILGGIIIDGTNSSAGAAGVHVGDGEEYRLDCTIQHFNGTGSKGLHLDNTVWWTEKMRAQVRLYDNTANVVLDVSTPATTVASGSNGGEISAIASWSSPSAGVLDVGTLPGNWPTAGTVNVAASGSTTAVVTYTGVSGNSLTGCAYVSGSATGTVSTGGAVSLVTSTNSFGYNDLDFRIFANPGQDGIQVSNGALLYHARLLVKGNFIGSSSSISNAVLRLSGSVPSGHPGGGSSYSSIENSHVDVQVESTSSTFTAQTVNFGTDTAILGCYGMIDFSEGSGTFTTSNVTVSQPRASSFSPGSSTATFT